MRAAASAIVLGVVACVLPAAAGAHSLVRPAGALVSYISADATSLNTLTVGVNGGRIEFSDPTVDGGMDTGNCTPGELGGGGFVVQTFCPLAGVQRVRIDLGEREDSATVALPIPTTLLGGAGADRIATGDATDELSGGEGDDLVTGGAGDDVLSGGPAADQLDGGPGADRIAADDGAADVVRCGEGADSVAADTLDQVAPDCESVARSSVAAPPVGADDGQAPELEVGAPTLQRIGRVAVVHVYATSSKQGTISASGAIEATGLALPIKTIERRRVRVGGGGVKLTYRLEGRHLRLARRALRAGRSVVVRLGVVATDLSGRSRRRDAPAVALARARGRSSAVARAAHPEPGDVDGDEVRDEVDNCPTVKNGSQVNTDAGFAAEPPMPAGDALGDACDGDDDADGLADLGPPRDNCRVVRNPDQKDSDGDGFGDACPPVDSDGDAIIDVDDNCDSVANPDQQDLDGDDKGDACDRDDDGDRFDDEFDNCPTVYNLEPTDVDGDGLIDDQLDLDGDGIGTLCDLDEAVVSPPPPAGPGPAPGPTDRAAPRLSIAVERRHEHAAVRAGLIVPLRCSEACGATAEVNLARETARRLGLARSRIVAGGSARLQGAGASYAFVRFSARARRVLFRQRRLRATLTTVAVDDVGNRRVVSRAIELHR